MKFNADDIFSSATNEFGEGVLGDESLDLVESCIEIAHGWTVECADAYNVTRTKQQLRRELKKHIRKRLDLEAHCGPIHESKGASFLPSFIWKWLAGIIINWIVRLIIDNLTN